MEGRGVLELLSIICALTVLVNKVDCRYDPTWQSIDSRPLPGWYDDAKFGIFIHWGVFSVPAFGSEWFWNSWESKSKDYVDFMTRNYPPNFTYPEFAPQFTAEFYDPDKWADLIQDSGAKYVVLTSKHHEGYTLWPSKYSWNWNALAIGPKRDLIGELATSIRTRTNVTFGLYHSLFEWYHPLYLDDKASGFKKRNFVHAKAIPELVELVNSYRPSVIWSDGDWEPLDTYWNSTGFLAWLYNDSPVKDIVVTNDRWGSGTACKHGGYYTCSDRYNPGTLQEHKWENAMTIDKASWGYRRNVDLSDFMNTNELIQQLAETVSCNGNLLMNIGPTHDGRIIPIFEERMRQMGQWLKINGEAIYSSKPWIYQNDTLTSGVWYTSRGSSVYAIVLNWPEYNLLQLGAINPPQQLKVNMLGYKPKLTWRSSGEGILIEFPFFAPDQLPSPYAWVLKFTNLGRVEENDLQSMYKKFANQNP